MLIPPSLPTLDSVGTCDCTTYSATHCFRLQLIECAPGVFGLIQLQGEALPRHLLARVVEATQAHQLSQLVLAVQGWQRVGGRRSGQGVGGAGA